MGKLKSIFRFLADERGSESVEFAIVALVVACGSVRGMLEVQAAVDARVAAAVEQLNQAQ